MLESLTYSEKSELTTLLMERERRRARRRIDALYPDAGPLRRALYPKHLDFFAAGATHRERLFMAGNRCGKTTAGAYETALHLTGEYPSWWEGRRFSRPVAWWCAGKTNETTRDIVQDALFGRVEMRDGRKAFSGTGTIPGDAILSASWRIGVNDLADTVQVRHISGGISRLGLKSYAQGRGSFEGTAQHGIWIDEEPSLDVYAEVLVRTMTTDGIVMITFTPLDGLSEVVLAFLEDGKIPGVP